MGAAHLPPLLCASQLDVISPFFRLFRCPPRFFRPRNFLPSFITRSPHHLVAWSLLLSFSGTKLCFLRMAPQLSMELRIPSPLFFVSKFARYSLRNSPATFAFLRFLSALDMTIDFCALPSPGLFFVPRVFLPLLTTLLTLWPSDLGTHFFPSLPLSNF